MHDNPRVLGVTGNTNSTKVYLISSSLLWAVLLVGAFSFEVRIWYPFLGAWTLGLVFDGTLLLLDSTRRSESKYDTFQKMAHSARVFVLLLLVGSASAFQISSYRFRAHGDTEPLLASWSADGTEDQYEDNPSKLNVSSDVEDDEEYPDTEAEELHKLRQRLHKRGSWIAYLKDFRVLVPLFRPSPGDRSVVWCLLVVILALMSERAFNVLIPRQVTTEERPNISDIRA